MSKTMDYYMQIKALPVYRFRQIASNGRGIPNPSYTFKFTVFQFKLFS